MGQGLSRRNVLKGAGAAALGFLAAKVQAAPAASDAIGVEKHGEEIRMRYTKLFKI